MGSGEKNIQKFHFHVHDHHKNEIKNVPKGCLAIMVGIGEEQERFIIPVVYINHPLFIKLLKEAEEEYGFDQKGPISIPCHVEEFRRVQGKIVKDSSIHHHHHHQHHHTHHHLLCFKV